MAAYFAGFAPENTASISRGLNWIRLDRQSVRGWISGWGKKILIWQIRVLAWLHIVLNGSLLLAGAIFWADLGLSSSSSEQGAAAYIGFFFVLLIPFLLPGLIGGIGLLRHRPWARIVIIILSALWLLEIPVGTIFGGFGLWVLLSRNGQLAFDPPARGQDRMSSSPTTWRRGMVVDLLAKPVTGVLLAMLLVGAGFVLFLAIGFHLSGTVVPPSVDAAVPASAIVVLVAAIAGAIVLTRKVRAIQQRRRIGGQMITAAQESRDQRIAELKADPAKQKYAPLVARGESWSDAEIAYHEDLRISGTCVHLRPIELAMRQAGINMRPITSVTVIAECRINLPEVKKDHPVAPPIYYVEDYQGERAAQDFPVAFFTCKSCYAAISVLHPDQSRADTKWYPQAPHEAGRSGSA